MTFPIIPGIFLYFCHRFKYLALFTTAPLDIHSTTFTIPPEILLLLPLPKVSITRTTNLLVVSPFLDQLFKNFPCCHNSLGIYPVIFIVPLGVCSMLPPTLWASSSYFTIPQFGQ